MSKDAATNDLGDDEEDAEEDDELELDRAIPGHVDKVVEDDEYEKVLDEVHIIAEHFREEPNVLSEHDTPGLPPQDLQTIRDQTF